MKLRRDYSIVVPFLYRLLLELVLLDQDPRSSIILEAFLLIQISLCTSLIRKTTEYKVLCLANRVEPQ